MRHLANLAFSQENDRISSRFGPILAMRNYDLASQSVSLGIASFWGPFPLTIIVSYYDVSIVTLRLGEINGVVYELISNSSRSELSPIRKSSVHGAVIARPVPLCLEGTYRSETPYTLKREPTPIEPEIGHPSSPYVQAFLLG